MTVRTTPLPISLGQGLRAGLIGGALAAVLNALLYFVGQALNGGPLEVSPPAGPMALPVLAVLLFSLAPGLVAGLLYTGLSRFAARPERWLLGVAVVVFALLFMAPFGAANTQVTLWTLELMHVAAAASILWAIFSYARR